MFKIIFNWKMNPVTLAEAKGLITVLQKSKKEIIVCPPAIYLSELISFNKNKNVKFGAQNVFDKNNGFFTGEISPMMLAKNKVDYVIVGHSERRLLGETDKTITLKTKASLKAGLKVVVCIGELARDINGDYFLFLKNQLLSILDGVSKNDLKNVLIAYEPVWAISGNVVGKAVSFDQLYEMSIFIKKVLADKYRTNFVFPDIIYGGSVGPKNIEVFLKQGGVNGVLIGKTGLDVKKVKEIID